MSVPAWLELPTTFCFFVPEIDGRAETPEALLRSMFDQLQLSSITIVEPNDPRFIEAVDHCFARLARELQADLFTPVLQDRAKGIVSVQRHATGFVTVLHLRVVLLQEPS